jgi:hypothetical protein
VPIAAAPAARAAFFATRLTFGRNVFFALVVVLLDFDLVRPRFNEDFDLVRPRFDEDLDLARLTLFFINTSLDVSPTTAQSPQYSKARRISIRNKREAMLILYKGPSAQERFQFF